MKYEPEENYDPQCTQETPKTISDDPECLVSESKSRLFGETEVEEKCQNTPSNLQEYLAGEQDCIFPFYYNGQIYHKCILFTEAGFTYPAFRCPVHNITTKRDGINDFTIRINKTATLIQKRNVPALDVKFSRLPHTVQLILKISFQTWTRTSSATSLQKEHLLVFVKTIVQELDLLGSLEAELWPSFQQLL